MRTKRDNLAVLSDEKLVKKSQKKDEAAFEALMKRHSDYILALAFKSGGYSNAEEILQETYIKCWQKIGTFKFKSSFKTWIYRVLKNNYYDLARKQIRKKQVEVSFCDLQNDENGEKNVLDFLKSNDILFSNDELPSSNIERREKVKYLRRIFAEVKKELNPVQRQVVKLVLEEEMTYQEAAKAMNCSVGTIMSRLFYARKNAQRIIKRHEKI